MDVVYLSLDLVVKAHARGLDDHGGLDGLRSSDLLEAAVFQPQQSVFGEDAYPSLAAKAAAYGFFIAENQPFLDGNKRTAAACMLAFLDLNGGLTLDRTDDEIHAAFIRLGSREISKEDFFAWVEESITTDL